jgi:two-component system CheB/CheR fusion protein
LKEASRRLAAWREGAAVRIARLTPREREIMVLIVAGQLSKNIAADLGISQRTVENHRAAIMKRTGATCFPSLVRLALAAAWTDGPDIVP